MQELRGGDVPIPGAKRKSAVMRHFKFNSVYTSQATRRTPRKAPPT